MSPLFLFLVGSGFRMLLVANFPLLFGVFLPFRFMEACRGFLVLPLGEGHKPFQVLFALERFFQFWRLFRVPPRNLSVFSLGQTSNRKSFPVRQGPFESTFLAIFCFFHDPPRINLFFKIKFKKIIIYISKKKE